MKSIITVLLILFSTSAFSVEAPPLFKKTNCLVCHAVNKKLIGPSFNDITEKYRSNSKAPEILFYSIQNGSKDTWGAVPMPAQKLDKDSTNNIVKWILQ